MIVCLGCKERGAMSKKKKKKRHGKTCGSFHCCGGLDDEFVCPPAAEVCIFLRGVTMHFGHNSVWLSEYSKLDFDKEIYDWKSSFLFLYNSPCETLHFWLDKSKFKKKIATNRGLLLWGNLRKCINYTADMYNISVLWSGAISQCAFYFVQIWDLWDSNSAVALVIKIINN